MRERIRWWGVSKYPTPKYGFLAYGLYGAKGQWEGTDSEKGLKGFPFAKEIYIYQGKFPLSRYLLLSYQEEDT